jgi:hypothetical protein
VFVGDGENENSDDHILIDNPVNERLVEAWMAEGGILGGFNLRKKNPARKRIRQKMCEEK